MIGLVGGLVAVLGGGGVLYALTRDSGPDPVPSNPPPVTSTPPPVETTPPTTAPPETTVPPETTPPTTSPTDGPPEGETVTLAEAVTFTVPPEWNIQVVGDGEAIFLSTSGAFMYAEVYQPGPAADGAVESLEAADLILTEENGYSNVQRGETVTFQPDAAIVSRGDISYHALWTGTQGSYAVEGVILVMVRQDGTGLVVQIETGDGRFSEDESIWLPVWQSLYSGFRGS